MARGTQFRELVNMLRAELGHSLQRSTGLNTVESQKYALRNTYQWLYDSHDWRFLRVTRDKPLEAGQRFYAMPEDMSYENVEKAWARDGDRWVGVTFGITPENYSEVMEGERSDPVRRWDSHDDDQFEVWPVPATDSAIRMMGVRKFKPLTDEKDVCLLDDLAVVFWTMARLAPKSKAANGSLYVDVARDRMRRMKIKARANKAGIIVMGGGSPTAPPLRPGLDYIPERR